MVSLFRREQFVSTLVRISYLTFNYTTNELLITELLSFFRKRKNGHCLSQCESIRLWSSQTTNFTSLLVEKPASKTREMRLLLYPSSCWKKEREFKKSSIAIRILCGLTSRGQMVSIRITKLSNFCRHAYMHCFLVMVRPNSCDGRFILQVSRSQTTTQHVR